MDKCGDCKFYRQPGSECRRFPPTLPPGDRAWAWKFPAVFEGFWCGEFVPRLTTQGEK